MPFEKFVDPVGVRAEVLVRVLAKKRKLPRGHVREPEGAELLVGIQRRLPEHLGQTPGAGPPVEVHLEQPVLGGDVPLEIEEVMRRLRVDVRDSIGVADHLGSLIEPEQAKLAVDRGERPIDEDEPGQDQTRDQEQRDRCRDDPAFATPASHSRSRSEPRRPPLSYPRSRAPSRCAPRTGRAARFPSSSLPGSRAERRRRRGRPL